MKKTCSWLLALAGLLSLVATTRAGTPPPTPDFGPALCGQEAVPAAPRATYPPSAYEPDSQDDAVTRSATADWLTDLLEDTLDLLIEYSPEVRMVVQQLRPCTPLHLAAAAALEYLSAMDAAQRSAGPVVGAVEPPPCCKDGNDKTIEVLPYPKVVGCPGTCTQLQYNEGNYSVPFTYGARSCVKQGPSFGVCPGVINHGVADACDNVICCQFVVQTCAADKACKCCKECKDSKECKCGKDATATFSGCVPNVVMECIRPSMPVAMPPMPPPFLSHPGMWPPPVHAMMPPMPPMPPCPLDELRDLVWQRQMITSAIQQIEQEIAWLATQQQVVHAQPVPVAHNAQKVHLVTEHFEAHCEALHCVGGDVHKVMLEGDVRLTCKKSGHAVHIEAPCVIVNMKDGTFTVEAQQPVAAPCPSCPASVSPTMQWGDPQSCPSAGSPRDIQFAPVFVSPAMQQSPVFVSPAMQWAVPNGCHSGPPIGTSYPTFPPAPSKGHGVRETLPMPCPVTQPPVDDDKGDKDDK